MRLLITMRQPYPPDHSWWYGSKTFAKFGFIWWEYSGGYRTPVQWINHAKSCFQPPFPEPESYGVHMFPGYSCEHKLIPVVVNRIEDIIINNVASNLLKGRGVPIPLP